MKLRNKLFKIVALLIIFILVSLNASYVLGVTFKEGEKTESYKEWEKLSDEEKENTIAPQKYETSSEGVSFTGNPIKAARLKANATDSFFCLDSLIPENLTIKNQYTTNTCWTFASLASLETTLALADYYANRTTKVYDYSERHMEYATTRTFADGINQNGFSRELDDGGSYQVSHTYLTNGTGAVKEIDMPFVNNKEKINLSDLRGEKATEVYDTRFFTEATNGVNNAADSDEVFESLKAQIKNFLVTYGGVECAMHILGAENTAINLETGAMYYDTKAAIDHDVLIIGWDDNYSKDNFLEGHRPEHDGAWIVKNSWGTQNGYHGYMYLSYDDLSARQLIAGIEKASDEKKYDNIYQYNFYGYSYYITMDSDTETILLANKFDREDSTVSEKLEAVNILLNDTAKCRVFVNAASDDTSLDSLVLVPLKGQDEDGFVEKSAGYHTFELANPINLTGDSFAIAIQVTETDGDKQVGIVLENTNRDAKYTDYAVVETGKTFVWGGSKWYDLGDLYTVSDGTVENGDSTIKAYTTLGAAPVVDPDPEPAPTPDPEPTPDPLPTTNEITEDPVVVDEKEATTSDFSKADAEVKTVAAYTYTASAKKNYETIDILISDIAWAKGNDKVKYYYYISSNPEEKNIKDWIEIKNVSKVGNTLSFAVKSTENPNYDELIEADNLYVYIKEVATLGTSTKTKISSGLKLGTKEVTMVIYKDDAIQSSEKYSGKLKIDYSKQSSNSNTSSRNGGSRTASTSKVDETVADKDIPQTGETLIMIEAILLVLGIGIATFVGFKKTKIK